MTIDAMAIYESDYRDWIDDNYDPIEILGCEILASEAIRQKCKQAYDAGSVVFNRLITDIASKKVVIDGMITEEKNNAI